jgi:hypothetical protein
MSAGGQNKIQTVNLTNRGRGRPKGSLNKTTAAAKDAIAQAAANLGGTDRLVEWAREDAKNEHAFWSSIYPKLLPLQVAGDSENPIHITTITREIVRP